jgi:hypothetical protein
MNTTENENIVLTYFSCNYRSIIVSGILVFLMSIIFFLIVLIKKITIHQQNKECKPLFFFLGETTGCQSVLSKSIKAGKKKKQEIPSTSILYNLSFFMHQFHL